jgi:hypothetical protein
MPNPRPALPPHLAVPAASGWVRVRAGFGLAALLLAACSRQAPPVPAPPAPAGAFAMAARPGRARIIVLTHSVGRVVWEGGLGPFFQAWNRDHGTRYRIQRRPYPDGTAGHLWLGRILPDRLFNKLFPDQYPWDNNPYDFWNLWVAHRDRVQGELTLEELTRSYDVIVFKHCFDESRVEADDGVPDVASPRQTLANYRLQYAALQARLHQFPHTRFILWTGAALREGSSTPEQAERARQFATWVKTTWDQKGDNIFIWDFRELETDGGLYLKPEYARNPRDSHPSAAFAARVAPLLGRRILDVIEGRGDTRSLTGR